MASNGPDQVARQIAESVVDDYFYEIFPNDLNANGTVFGGRVMELADRVAGGVCRRHCHWRYVTTAAVDSIRFLEPARRGETLSFKSSINRVWKTSMEIGVKVMAEDYSGGEVRHIFSAYFTYVTVDEAGNPLPATPAIAETAEQKRRWQSAEQRRAARLGAVVNSGKNAS